MSAIMLETFLLDGRELVLQSMKDRGKAHIQRKGRQALADRPPLVSPPCRVPVSSVYP